MAFAMIVIPQWASSQEIGRLYAARPPEGSAFVRVVSGLGRPVRVALNHGEPDELTPGKDIASIYRIAPGDKPVTLTADGKPLTDTIPVVPGNFITVLLQDQGGALNVRAVVDVTGERNDLKAELRVYNLIPGCNAALAVSDGPTVFKDVPPDASQRRSINPVVADLVGRCGDTATNSLRLAGLKSGDRFSLFLTGSVNRPVLSGQVDATETYSGWAK
jgi:alginate O-acetyltransferase complex protein AlgF